MLQLPHTRAHRTRVSRPSAKRTPFCTWVLAPASGTECERCRFTERELAFSRGRTRGGSRAGGGEQLHCKLHQLCSEEIKEIYYIGIPLKPSVVVGAKQAHQREFEKLLVDSGSPVTIMRRDLRNEVSGDNELLNTEEEHFQGVTEHGLEMLGRTHVRLRFEKLDVAHPVVVVDNIAHKFIIGNDFLLLYKCDILYLQDAKLFGGKLVPFKLFRSTINLISPVICQATTEVGPSEEVAIPCLLDSWKQYDARKSLLLEPRQDALMGAVLGARVLVNSLSPAITLLVANLSK